MTDTTQITRDEMVQIDTRLGELSEQRAKAYSDREQARMSLASQVGIRSTYVTRTRREVRETMEEILYIFNAKKDEMASYNVEAAEKRIRAYNDAQLRIIAAKKEAAPLDAIYATHRWSRFFLVTSSAGGHIHSSTSCSTCRLHTTFGWLPSLSGLTEADAVAEHGAILCTVCYPSAPVEWTQGIEKPVDPDQCPGSGTARPGSEGIRYTVPRAVCTHCRTTQSVTSTGKLRKHKGVSA